MMSDRGTTMSDRRRVRKLIIQDQAVDTPDLNTAKRFINGATRFRQLFIGLTVGGAALLLVDIIVGVASGRWVWTGLISPPLLILLGANYIRDDRLAKRWVAHHPDVAQER